MLDVLSIVGMLAERIRQLVHRARLSGTDDNNENTP